MKYFEKTIFQFYDSDHISAVMATVDGAVPQTEVKYKRKRRKHPKAKESDGRNKNHLNATELGTPEINSAADGTDVTNCHNEGNSAEVSNVSRVKEYHQQNSHGGQPVNRNKSYKFARDKGLSSVKTKPGEVNIPEEGNDTKLQREELQREDSMTKEGSDTTLCSVGNTADTNQEEKTVEESTGAGAHQEEKTAGDLSQQVQPQNSPEPVNEVDRKSKPKLNVTSSAPTLIPQVEVTSPPKRSSVCLPHAVSSSDSSSCSSGQESEEDDEDDDEDEEVDQAKYQVPKVTFTSASNYELSRETHVSDSGISSPSSGNTLAVGDTMLDRPASEVFQRETSEETIVGDYSSSANDLSLWRPEEVKLPTRKSTNKGHGFMNAFKSIKQSARQMLDGPSRESKPIVITKTVSVEPEERPISSNSAESLDEQVKDPAAPPSLPPRAPRKAYYPSVRIPADLSLSEANVKAADSAVVSAGKAPAVQPATEEPEQELPSPDMPSSLDVVIPADEITEKPKSPAAPPLPPRHPTHGVTEENVYSSVIDSPVNQLNFDIHIPAVGDHPVYIDQFPANKSMRSRRTVVSGSTVRSSTSSAVSNVYESLQTEDSYGLLSDIDSPAVFSPTQGPSVPPLPPRKTISHLPHGRKQQDLVLGRKTIAAKPGETDFVKHAPLEPSKSLYLDLSTELASPSRRMLPALPVPPPITPRRPETLNMMRPIARVETQPDEASAYITVLPSEITPETSEPEEPKRSASDHKLSELSPISEDFVDDSYIPMDSISSKSKSINSLGHCGSLESLGLGSSTDSDEYVRPDSFYSEYNMNRLDSSCVSSESSGSRPGSWVMGMPAEYMWMASSMSNIASKDYKSVRVKNPSPEKVKSKKEKLYFVVEEIATSEKNFIAVLDMLNKDFKAALDRYTKTIGHEIVPADVLDSIFKDLPDLQKINETLLTDIETRLAKWDQEQKVTDIFIKMGPFLKLYSGYIMSYDARMQALDDARKKYPEFDKMVLAFEGSAKMQKLALKHYMLKPVQRLPQYRLLLQEYKKYLTEDMSDFPDIDLALKVVSEAAAHANQSMKYEENLEKIMNIQERLLGNYELIKPGRVLLKEGLLNKSSRKVIQPRYFHLFDDILLYTSPISNGTYYKLNNVLPLQDMEVKRVKSEETQFEFNIITKQRSFAVIAANETECNEWMQALNDAIKECQEKVQSYKGAGQSLIVRDDDTNLGSRAPVWIPDQRVSMCMICAAEFSLVFRRHHCRACGRVVCTFCSRYKAPLKYMDNKTAKVCRVCYDKLKKDVRKTMINASATIEVNKQKAVATKFAQSSSMKLNLGLLGEKNLQRISFVGEKLGLVPKRKSTALKEIKAHDDSAAMSGYLKVWRDKKWVKNWYVLKGHVLYSFKKLEDTAAADSQVILGFVVEHYTSYHHGAAPNLLFSMEHNNIPQKIYQCDSPATTARWVTELKKAAVLS